jgi:hypothetical protein
MLGLADFVKRRWRAVIISVLAANLALVAAEWLAPTVHKSIEPVKIHHLQGHEYKTLVVEGWPIAAWKFPYEVRVDTDSRPTASTLILTEDGSELGPAHASKDAIIKKGEGSFLHDQNDLVFSASDNSDPRTNGRDYAVSSGVHVNTGIVTLVFSISILMLGYLAVVKARTSGVSSERVALMASLGSVVLVHIAFLLLWFARPHYINISPDSWGYLEPALSASSGGPFTQTNARGLGYPIFLYGILSIFHSIHAIVHAQVALYLGISALLFLCWREVTKSNINKNYILQKVLLAIMLFSFIFSSLFQDFIYFIQTEIFYAFMVLLCVYLLLLVFFNNFSPMVFSLIFLAASFFTVFNYFVKPHWGGAMVFILGLLIVRLFTARSVPVAVRIALPVVSCGLILFGLVLPQQRLSETYSKLASTEGPKTLFCNNADLVVRYMESPDYKIDPKDVLLAKSVKGLLDRVVTEGASGGWRRLGFDGDKCMYSDDLSISVRNHFEHDPSRIERFYLSHFMGGVLNDPLKYASRVIKQILKASVAPMKRIGDTAKISDETIYEILGRYREIDELFLNDEPLSGDIESVFNFYVFNEFQVVPEINIFLFLMDPFFIIVWIAMGVYVFSTIFSKERWSALSISKCLPCLIITGAYFSSLVVVAVAHTFDFQRYSVVLTPLALLSVFSCAYTLVGLVKPGDIQKMPG